MANIGTSAVKIIDNDSDTVAVNDNRLDVNSLVYGYDYSSANRKLKVDSSGLVYVKSIADDVAVTGSFYQATQPVSIASAVTVQGAAAADATISGNPVPVGAKYAAQSLDINDVGYLRIDSSGILYTTVSGATNVTLNSLPAGSNAIGTLAANSGVDIGDVDVTSTVLPEGHGTFTSYAQDTSATSSATVSTLIGGAVTDCKEIIIQADNDNASFIMVGDSAVGSADTEGIRLNAGDTLILPVASTANVSVSGPDTSQKFNICILK